MTTYLSNRDSDGKTNEEGHYRFQSKIWTGNILEGMKVVQNTTPNLTVLVQKGDIRIPYGNYAYLAWSDSDTSVAVTTSNISNPRIDRIVAYIDRSMTFISSQTNNPGALKYKAVAGTPSSSPVKATDSVVTNSVGANNPWVEIATLRVNTGVTQVTDTNLTDTRVYIYSALINDRMFPIGSIYTNASVPDNPAALFGFGTWQSFGTGRVLVGQDPAQSEFLNAGQLGGSKAETISEAQMPSHYHSGNTDVQGQHNHGTSGDLVATSGGGNQRTYLFGGSGQQLRWSVPNIIQGNGAHLHYFNTNWKGGNQPHNNLQPYVVVYMWIRIA